jgi:ABC-2 type transport system permease protein
LTRGDLVIARLVTVLLVETVQVAVLIGTAILLLGWAPGAGVNPVLGAVAIVLGTAAFAGLGLLLAGRLRGETVLALANLLFLAFLVIGGIIVPIERLPTPVATVAAALPAAPLADLLRTSLGSGGAEDPAGAIALLGGWALVTVALATRRFRWE